MSEPLRIMVSRHSAFYSPLIAAIGGGFLKREGIDATYSILGPGQRSQDLIRDGVVDVMQSAVSSNWKPLERGEGPLPVHFAQINRRDGFFLTAREPDPAFTWKKLEGSTLRADHGGQPLAMLKYAVHYNGVDWDRIRVVASGYADYGHYQAPHEGVPLISVGASMPEVAFSSLCASKEWLESDLAAVFLRAFTAAKEWVRSADAEEVAAAELPFFPGVESAALADAVRRYRQVGCWDGGVEISRAFYEQALNVFAYSGGITERHAYDKVVGAVVTR